MTASTLSKKGFPAYRPSGLFGFGFFAGLAMGCVLLLFAA